MRAGELRQRVSIVRPSGTEGFGLGDVREIEVRSCNAQIRPLAGGERVNGQQVEGAVSHAIRIRYSPDAAIDSACVVVSGSRRFQIRSVIDVEERNRELLLLCDGA